MWSTISSQLFVRATLLLILAFLVVACGSNTQVRAPAATNTALANATHTLATATPDQVQLTLSKARYALSEDIVVTITNRRSTSIFLSPSHTDCTVVVLERAENTTWMPQGRCLLDQFPHTSALAPGSTTQQHLTPASNGFKSASASLWQPGTYRITLMYSLTPDPDTYDARGILASSDPFTVG